MANNYKNYVVLLKDFNFEDENASTKGIFEQLKDSNISMVASNGASETWHLIITFLQTDEFDQSDRIIQLMSPAVEKFNLQIEKVWPEDKSDT